MQNDSATTTTPPTTCLEQALKSRDPRISVLPIRGDGSKSPLVKLKHFQMKLCVNEEQRLPKRDWTFLGDEIR